MEYFFKWRSRFITRKRKVMGHLYDSTQDKMILYYANGSVEEVCNWRSCAIILGQDWCLAQKKNAEKASGVSIPIDVK
jgi:hypothetical protein